MRDKTWALPLLAKELAEQSARPRTYILRFLYGAIIYSITLWGLSQTNRIVPGQLGLLGQGFTLFVQILLMQIAAVYLVLPALMAGVMTSEKERDTLGLLLITKLTPGKIVLQKFLGRVIPMLLYLSMSLPLWGVAYSMGGLSMGQIGLGIAILIVAVAQMGTIGLLASTWCRTTAQALIASYAIAPFSIAIVAFLTGELLNRSRPIGPTSLGIGIVLIAVPFAFAFLPALGGLGIARLLLWSRASLPPGNRWLKVLQGLDRWFHSLNQNSFTKGIVLVRDSSLLPHSRPIAWRETQKRSMGNVRYLIRLMLLIQVPLLFVIFLPLMDDLAGERGGRWMAMAYASVLWISVFAVMASSTSLFSGERSRQTLDVLLSTPLSSEQIVREKYAGILRLIVTLWVPLGTVLLCQIWWQSHVTQPWIRQEVQFIATTQRIAIPLIGLPLLGWLGLHASLRFRSQLAAMTTSMGLILGLIGIPLLYRWLNPEDPQAYYQRNYGGQRLELNPLEIFFALISPTYDLSWLKGGLLWLVGRCAIYTGVWLWLKKRAAGDLDRLTGRCGGGHLTADGLDPLDAEFSSAANRS